MDEVHLTLKETLFETHTVNVRHNPVRFWCVMMSMKLIRTPMEGGDKLHLVSMDQMKNKQVVIVI